MSPACSTERPHRAIALALGLLLAGCGGAGDRIAVFQPPPGSNAVFREETKAAPGHELIVADLNLPPNAVGEPHWHPWEEYLYVIGGSAIVSIEGAPPRTVSAGEHVVLPRRSVHRPQAGPQGVRAIVVRVHRAGDPVSVPATQPPPATD